MMGGRPCVLLLLGVALLCSLPPVTQAKKIPKWWMKVAQRQGPNACVVEEVPGTGKEFWTECRYWLNRKICGRKTIVRFECCEGFEQIEGENGCTRVKPLMNLLETAESLGATRWAAYIRESGLANELETAGAYTLFAPTNEAFDGAKASLKSLLESYRGNPNNPVLLYHIVPTKLPSDHFEANTVIETRHSGNFIRINKYSNGMNTINCALLLQKDQQATNGIVHVIDSMLDPSKSLPENVADMVLKDGRFTVLSEMLEKSGYINVLRTMQGSITFLAPSDEAFQKLPDSRREKIINDREARLALIQNHIIPHVICESAITGEHRVRTVSSNKLTFNCDIEGAYVETSKLRSNFNLGKNGIIHILDDVLLPDRAKNLIELAESRQLFTFAELVRNAGLEETLSHTGDYTFFVPDENAWFELDADVLRRARNDVEYAGLLIRFHGAYGRHLTNAITDNQAIMSLDEENPVRLQVWRRAMGVEDARITTPDVEAQNGVIHIINKVIFPSNQSATETLRSLPGGQTFDTYLDVLQRATSQTPPVLTLRPGDDTFYTFFVPTDEAFGRMEATTQGQLRSGDPGIVTSFVKKHMAINMFPSTSFEPNLIYSIEGMDGSNFNLKKDGTGKLTANGVSVSSSHMSANGVIHVIESVFTPTGGYGGSSHSSSTRTYGYGGGSGRGSWSSSTSSSSSTGGGSATRTTKTYRKTVTFAEGFDDADNRLPAVPQGSHLASSVRGRPELAPSPPAASPLPAHTQPSSSAGSRGVSQPQHPANYPASIPGTASLDVSNSGSVPTDNTARLHDNTDRYPYTSSSPSETPDPSSNGRSSGEHEHEPGLDQWERRKHGRGNSGQRRQGHGVRRPDETYYENNIDDLDYEEERFLEDERRLRLEETRQEEIERQREIARQEEITRQAEITRQEEISRQAEIDKQSEIARLEEIARREEEARQVEIERQEEIRRREEVSRQRQMEEERRKEIVRQRQEELRVQQEENAKIEEENRLREIENRRQEEVRRRHEQQLIIEENRRRQETIHVTDGDRQGYGRGDGVGYEEESYRRSGYGRSESEGSYEDSGYGRGVGGSRHEGSGYGREGSEVSYEGSGYGRGGGEVRQRGSGYDRGVGGAGSEGSGYGTENNSEVSRSRYHWSSSNSYTGGRGRTERVNELHEPGLITRSFDGSSIAPIDTLTNLARNNSTVSSSKITTQVSSHNTIGPITPNGTRYSYVGRSYGDDIVGHNSNAIPYTRNDNSEAQSATHVLSSNKAVEGPHGITTTTTRRRVNVTRTVYSYPVPSGGDRGTPINAIPPSGRAGNNRDRSSSSSNFYRQHQFSYPNRAPAAGDKSGSDLVSAYAFTGGETEFADGQEFVESGAPVVATITVNQARAMRRQWRRKRHHMLRNKALSDAPSDNTASNKKGRKRMRKGRGRGMRKAFRKRQAQRRMREQKNVAESG